MSKVLKLVHTTDDARHWGAKDVLEAALEEFKRGDIKADSRVLVLHISKDNSEVGFIQNGLCHFSILGLLESAKMNIYRKFME